MTDVRLKMSPPWITYVNKLQALFDGDPLIAFNIDYDAEDGPSVTLATTDPDKAAALIRLLPEEKEFGNVILSIYVDSPTVSNLTFPTNKALFETAFKGNPAFAEAIAPAAEGYFYIDFTYIIFKNCVVQFFNDNLNDAHGLISTLYQEIAKEIFEDAGLNGVYYCTDIEHGNLGKPLGEWP